MFNLVSLAYRTLQHAGGQLVDDSTRNKTSRLSLRIGRRVFAAVYQVSFEIPVDQTRQSTARIEHGVRGETLSLFLRWRICRGYDLLDSPVQGLIWSIAGWLNDDSLAISAVECIQATKNIGSRYSLKVANRCESRGFHPMIALLRRNGAPARDKTGVSPLS